MVQKKSRKRDKGLQEIKIFLRKTGPSTSAEIWDEMEKKGDPIISKSTFYDLLRAETDSSIGELLKLEMPGITYYHLERQGADLFKRLSADLLNGKIKARALAEALISHSTEINRVLGLMSEQLPVVSLQATYPAGGFQIESSDVDSYHIGSRCDRKGLEKLPVEDDVLFSHLFEHAEIGLQLKDDWYAFTAAMLTFEEQKGRLYCTIDTLVRDRVSTITDRLVVNSSFSDCLYDMAVCGCYDVDVMGGWKLRGEGTFLRIDRGEGSLTDGWLFARDPAIITRELEEQLNLEYHKLLSMVMSGDNVSDSQAIRDEFMRLIEWRKNLNAKIAHLRLHEIYSMCPLVMAN